MHRPIRSYNLARSRAITAVEVLVIVAIVGTLMVILVPTFFHTRDHFHKNTTCLGHEKQIALGMMQYTQDWDGQYPPAYLPLPNDRGGMTAFGASYECLLYPYVKSQDIFHCPNVFDADSSNPSLSYMYNDLIAGAFTSDSAHKLSVPALTVVVTDGDAPAFDVGHAWTPNAPAQAAMFDRQGHCMTGYGATLNNALTRHEGKANYIMADGHVKTLSPEQVFFPPRSSDSVSHLDAHGKAIGPDPNGAMTFEGRKYVVTFHMR